MKNKSVVIVDGNNNLMRAFYKYKNMQSKKGEPSNIVFGFPLMMGALLKRFKPDDMVIAFDSDRHKERYKLLPNYKNREKKIDFDYENFQEQNKIAIKTMNALGVDTCKIKGQEADDLIYLLVKHYRKLGYTTIIIASRDKDFRPLITSKVSLWVVTDDYRLTHKNHKQIVGWQPRQFLDYLILDGDKSDKIPGYPGFGEKTITTFLNEYSSIKKYLASGEQFRKIDNQLLEEVYNRNRMLIGIRLFCNKHLKNLELKIKKGNKGIDYTYISEVSNRFDINTFVDTKFIKPFKKLNDGK